MPIYDGQSGQSSHHPQAGSTGAGSSSDQLDRLRRLRNRPDRARGIGDDLLREMKSLKKISLAESSAMEAWKTATPDQISDYTQIAGLKAGKLIVMVPGAAQRHVVDRWLKSGGMSEIQALARVPIRGIELRISPQTTG